MTDTNYVGDSVDLLLGREFLTWLWYRSENGNGLFRMTKESGYADEPFLLSMHQRVVVKGGEGENQETASVSGSQSLLREARLGLLTGKQVTRALVRLEKDGLDWQLTLRAEDFVLGSLKTPPIAREDRENDDPDARFLEKIYLIDLCLAMLDDMYRQFLVLRLAPAAWSKEVAQVAAWMQRDPAYGLAAHE